MTPAQQAHQRALEDAAKAIERSNWHEDQQGDFENAWAMNELIRHNRMIEAKAALSAAYASLAANGYKVTPREPTPEMIGALDFSKMHSEWHVMHDVFQWPPLPAEDK